MGLYPIALELANQECLVIGGGEIAERKADALLQAGARVTVVSPELTPNLEALARAGFVRWLPREYREGDLAGFVLAMAATDCEPVNRRVSAEARSRKIPVNVCDRPELCSFIVPAVVRQGDLILAVFTGGQSPMLARQIREQLAGQFGPEYAELLELLGGLRSRLKREIPDQGRRMEVYRRLVYSEALNLLRQGRRDQVESLAEELIRVERAGAV